MSKERIVIDQALCELVKYVVQGGANMKQAAAMTGVSPATISRIRAAGYSADRYMENTKQRTKEERIQKRLEERVMPSLEPVKEIPGQMAMDLQKCQEIDRIKDEATDPNKMIRFLAAKFEQMHKDMMLLVDEIRKVQSF